MEKPTEIKTGIIAYLREELDVIGQCRRVNIPLWQCPRLLFVGMGALIILAIIFTYIFTIVRTEPEMAALIVMGVAAFLIVQSYLILFATENLAETSRLKTEFINITSHQLRSPLTASKWATELLLELVKTLPPDAQENFRIIENSNQRMAKLVYLLLQVARIEANTMKQHKSDVSFNEIVKNAIESDAFFARASNLKIEFPEPVNNFTVNFDPEQLSFVIKELLDNSIRYSAGGNVVRISLTPKGGQVLFEIKDSGAGIPKEEQKNIFKKFYRGSNTYTLSPGGTGLSLFIIKKMIEACGGRIGFRSVLGQGSVFWFTLPSVKTIQKTNLKEKPA